ncbi:hypothetical protein [Rhabdobacter roseus]|nr:hypothetical protein [Rhabdobacter roseus]
MALIGCIFTLDYPIGNAVKQEVMREVVFDGEGQKERYLLTLKELRARNFKRNLPFLILSDKLPEGQVYREFPDGRIELQHVFVSGSKFESKLIQVLVPSDAERVRKEHELF